MPAPWIRGWLIPKQGMFVYYSPTGKYPYVVLRLIAAVYQPCPVIFTGRDFGSNRYITVREVFPFRKEKLTSEARIALKKKVEAWGQNGRLRWCLVYGPDECVYFEVDGAINRSNETPSGGVWNL